MKPLEISAEEVKRAGGDVGAAVRLHSAGIHAKGELDGASEKRVMAEIIAALEAKGYRTPGEWKPGARGIYMRVGQARADKGGSDKGAPDLIVIELGDHRGYGNQYHLLEVKARTKAARASKEQNTLRMLGIVTIVKSAGETLALLES